MTKTKKRIIIIGAVLVLIVVTIVLCVSPLTKYLIEKYDTEYTGREIEMDWAYVNPFTGYVHIENLKIYEFESESIFLSAKGLSADWAMFKLLKNTYEISEITLKQPIGYVYQYKKYFNFNDLIEKFSSKENKSIKKDPVQFNMLNIKIEDGEFHFREDQIPIRYFIKDVSIESDGWQYNVDTLPLIFSFAPGVGSGNLGGNLTINLSNLNYELGAKINNFDLDILNQYLNDLTNYGHFAAILDADIQSTGNFRSADSMSFSGNMTVDNFHFGKSVSEDFAAFDKLVIGINQLSPKNNIYDFDSISLNKPYVIYELYDSLDNIQNMFGQKGTKVKEANATPNKFNLVIAIANVIEQLSRNFFRSQYQIGRLAIYNGNLHYNDFTMSEQFSVSMDPFTVIADSVDKNKNSVNIRVQSGIKPFGDAKLTLSVNPRDSSYFDLNYRLEKIPLTLFNPYLTSYTSFPLDRGGLELSGKWNVRDGNIRSTNHLIVIDPRISKRVKNKDNSWLPLPIAMAFIRENGNVIDYEIPITGNLNDPKFHLRDVITDMIKNILVKPVTTPYRIEIKKVERELEKSLRMKWSMHCSDFSSSHIRFIKKMTQFLKENPEAKITVSPKQYEIKEKEAILLFEAKKIFYLINHPKAEISFSEEDSLDVSKISIKQPEFKRFLDKSVQDPLLYTAQSKASKIFKKSFINLKYKNLIVARKSNFLHYFKETKTENQVNFIESISTIPFNGYSFYSISYAGNYPEYLKSAFKKMNEYDSENPREKYKIKRYRNKKIK